MQIFTLLVASYKYFSTSFYRENCLRQKFSQMCGSSQHILPWEIFHIYFLSLSFSLSCSRWRVVRQTRRFSSTRSQRVTKLWLIWFPPKRAQTEKQLIRYCQSIHLTLPLKISNIIVKIWDQPGLFCLFSSFNQYNNKYSTKYAI